MSVYYTVDRRVFFRPNTKLDLLPKQSDEDQPLIKLAPEQFKSGLSPHGMEYLVSTHNHIHNRENQPSAMIEYALELLRQQRYPSKPSRFVSMFACETLDSAKHFRGQYFPNKLTTPIYEIISHDNVHRGDMNLLNAACSISEFDRRLNAYWSGESLYLDEDYEPFWEILIPLPAHIGDLIT